MVLEEVVKPEWVSTSTVELIKDSASDYDVAKAAWVSNFSKEDIPVQSPDKWDFGIYKDYLKKKEKSESKGDQFKNWYKGSIETVEKYNERIGGLINFLYRERHMSPFEHGSMTFYVDTPIFVAREFMRHRTFSYNETSGRYKQLNPRFFLVDSERPLKQEGKVGAYRFVPGTDEQYGTVFLETSHANQVAWDSYQEMLSQGVAREVARNVLPVNTMTQFYVTGNPRNWMQFFLLRNDPNALAEIRQVAQEIEKLFAKKMPITHAAFQKYDWRTERDELAFLRAWKSQEEAYETYEENITA